MLQSVWFPALLKSVVGEVLSYGAASVVPETGDVNFKSDFVPLFPMGSVLVITRLDEGNEVINYMGKVYISNRKLMRLVSAKREIIAGANYIFRDLPFLGIIKPLREERPPVKNILRFKAKAAEEAEQAYKVNITGLGQHALVFQYDSLNPFYSNQRFVVKADLPIALPETVIEIEKAFIFGKSASYSCRMTELADEERKKLVQFLMLYSFS